MVNKLFCKICGKEIKGCLTCQNKVFNWKNFACCYEHAILYLKLVEKGDQKDER